MSEAKRVSMESEVKRIQTESEAKKVPMESEVKRFETTKGILTEAIKAKILEQASVYPQKNAFAVEALKIVQREYQWIDDERLRAVAALLEMTSDELGSVASFYNMVFQRPVGRHVIFLCDSISCWILGCNRLSKCLKEKLGIGLGETSSDGRFTLLPICCIGECGGAPALMVNEDTFTDVNPESIEEIIKKYE